MRRPGRDEPRSAPPRPYRPAGVPGGRPDHHGGRLGPGLPIPLSAHRPEPSPVERLAEDEEVVAGRRPVEEAFAARRAARRLLVVPDRREALERLVLHATTLRIPVVEVEGGTLTALCGFDGHQGVALVVEPRPWSSLEDVLAVARARREPPFLLVLDHLEDPQNVGTLLRSAEACGVHGVLFPTRHAAPLSAAAVKASAGAVEHLRLVPVTDVAAGLVDLHALGVRIVGADETAPLTFREADMRGPVAIVVGSEGHGMGARVRRRIDVLARIPMRGRVASLNAAVAGSILLFEAATQRALPDPGPSVAGHGHEAGEVRGHERAPQGDDHAPHDQLLPPGHDAPGHDGEAQEGDRVVQGRDAPRGHDEREDDREVQGHDEPEGDGPEMGGPGPADADVLEPGSASADADGARPGKGRLRRARVASDPASSSAGGDAEASGPLPDLAHEVLDEALLPEPPAG